MKKKRTNLMKPLLRPLFSSLLLAGVMLPGYAEVTDLQLKEGKLPNGLTYYIYRNTEPSGRVDFYLSRNIGSRVEETDEKGLAHFLEHMCFNGSRNFPDNRIIEWLESVGVKFGKNLNAYTSVDETVYNISMVPVARESVVDSCLMVIRDWSDGLTLSDEAIDAERGVIKGEWRHRDNAASRMLRRAARRLYPGTPYEDAMPMGTMEVVENFPPQKLRDFYKKWYTPGAEAVIVAGDVNPEEIEKKITAIFNDMETTSQATNLPEPIFPVNEKLSVIVESDPEQAVNMMQLYFKHDDRGLSADQRLRQELLAELISSMLIERYDALELADNTPVANIGLGDTFLPLSKKLRAYVVRAQLKPGRAREALQAVYRELRRAREKGFSNEDFENARAELLEKERNKAVARKSRSNTDVAKDISRYFTEGGVFETPAARLERVERILAELNVEDCRERLAELIDPSGRNAVVLTYLRPGKDGDLPSEKDLESAFYSVNSEEILPFVAPERKQTILDSEPVRGSVVKSEPLNHFGATLLTLSNGIKVMMKPTDLKENQIFIRGVGEGGFSQNYKEEDAPSLKIFNEAMSLSGAGNHSNGDLRRMMASRDIKVSLMADRNDETLEVSSGREALEDAMRLLWLKATSTVPDEESFNAWYTSRMHQLEGDISNPVNKMGDLIHKSVYSNHPLGHKLTAEMLSKADYGRIMKEYADRFGDFSDFTFYITGDFDPDEMKDLLERYVASLPAKGRMEKRKDIGYRFTPGNQRIDVEEEMINPTGIVYQFRHVDCPYNLKNILLASMTGQILKARLLADLREDKGWTYSITTHGSVTAGMNGDDAPEFMMPVYVKIDPAHISESAEVIKSTLKGMSEKVSEEEFEKVKEYMAKSHEENIGENAYWLAAMKALNRFGLDLDSDYDLILSSLTPDMISAFVRDYVLSAQLTEITMSPAEKK